MISLNQVENYSSEISTSCLPDLWKAGKNGQQLALSVLKNKVSFLTTLNEKKSISYTSSKGATYTWNPALFKNKFLSSRNALLIEKPFISEEISEMFSTERFCSWTRKLN